MAKNKKTAAESDPVYLNESQRLGQRNKCQIGVRLPPEMIERLRNLIWATGAEGGVNRIIEEATAAALERLEKKYEKENGRPVPTRPSAKL
jgi:predicted DNA-binding protein